jgi:hypothetical protein
LGPIWVLRDLGLEARTWEYEFGFIGANAFARAICAADRRDPDHGVPKFRRLADFFLPDLSNFLP